MSRTSTVSQLNRKVQYGSFGERLRAVRKESQMTQSEFAEILGTSKQVISRYEKDQAEPTIRVVQRFAEKLQVSVEYLVKGNEYDLLCDEVCGNLQGKPFYKVFIDVVYKGMGLEPADIAKITGLPIYQVKSIVWHRMRYAPLDLAMQLSRTLNVPVDVWTGNANLEQTELSDGAREIARAYDDTSARNKSVVRYALNLQMVEDCDI